MIGPPVEANFRLALDERLTVLSVSPGVESLLGFSAEDFLTSRVSLKDRIHSDDSDIAGLLFSSHIEDKPRTFNIRLRHADGRIRCVKGQYTKEPAKDGGGAILDLLLQDAKSLWMGPAGEPMTAHFRALMENTDDFIFFKDRNHVFTGASQNITKSLDPTLSYRSVLGLTDYDVFPEKYADIYYRLEKQVFAGVPVASEVHESLKLDGSLAWLDNRKYPIRNDERQVIGLFGVVRDVTEHMKAQQAAAEAEGKYRDIFDGAVEGMFRTTIDGRALIANNAVVRILGYDSREDALGSVKDLSRDLWVDPAERAVFLEKLRENEAHAILGYECRFKRKDGTPVWVSVNARLVHGDSGKELYIDGFFMEITKRKRAEAALRESEESLKESQRIAGLGSYVTDILEGTWTSSEVLDQVFGIDKEYVRTVEGWGALVHPDDRASMVAYFVDEVIGRRKPFDREYRIVRQSDGAVRWVHGLGRLDFDAQGQPVKMYGTVWDITEAKQAEAALRESKELLQLFIEHAPAGLAMFDREMRYVAASDRWLQMHSLVGREVIGHSEYEIFPELPESWKEEHRRALSGEALPSEERCLKQPNGKMTWVRREIIPWLTGDGAVGGIIIFSDDIGWQKQAEAALRESKELLQLFIEHAPVAIAMFDREMRYLAASHRWGKDHSVTDREIIGRSHYEINPDVPERWKETHRRGLAGERQRVEEDRYDRGDGSMQWIRWEIIPWTSANGSIGGIVMFYEDITERRKAEEALRANKELLELFIERAPAALAMFDRDMRYLYASHRWLEEYSLLNQEIIGHSHYEIVPDIPERWKEAHRRGLAGETLREEEDRFERADGTVQWIRWEVIPWRESDGSVGGIILFAEDISRQKQTEERLRLSASVFTNAREGITITDREGTILDVNDTFTRITGYSREEAIGQNPRLLKSGLQSEEFYANMWRSLVDEGQWSGEIWNRKKSGEIIAETLTINAVHDASGNLLQYVALFSDVTKLKEHERQLEHVTNYDVLTSLPNRALLADRLRQAMTLPSGQNRLLAVAYLDLDGFKHINDRHGHSAGDRLLTSLAFNMKCALRKGDTLARLGGDEFVAVLLELDDPEASKPVLNRLLEAAAELVQVGDISLSVTASVGVAFYRQKDDVDADSLLRQADQAMYQAKLAGGNRFHIFDPDHDQLVRGRHENLEHIRQALAAREFVLYYQPKVNMRTGKVVGAEALIRWQHPLRGLLPPGMFLPVIEEHPLAIELGEWVIDSTLAQIESWNAAGLEIPVSVNVGALQLQQTDFVDRLSNLLAAHPNVKPSSLELEVLETSALQDVVQTSQVLNACHSIGVSFALDDFGTGYSSLTYLKRLPARILKIDQSFVSDMLEDPENLNILEGVLGLASAFHRQVIAEGVETVEHGLMLLRLGCELAQGYGIARPMPARDLPGWMSGWRPDPRWAEVPPVHSGNRTLLYACVEHRAWIAAFDAFLLGKRHGPPALDQHQCRFGAWLDTEIQAGRGQHAAYRSAHTTHRQFHALASAIVAAQALGRNAEGIGRLGELHSLGDELQAQLETLMQSC